MFMQGYQYTVNMGGKLQSYPSSEAYDLIFLTATILSTMSILLAVILYRISPPKCQNQFRVDKRDMGHIHGHKLADLPFPIEIRKQLIASGKVLPHIIYPESMWVSYFIRSEEDAPKIIDLFRLQYERLKYKPTITSPR